MLSDGKTVWVNNPICVAKFSGLGYEYTSLIGLITIPFDKGPTLDHWNSFVLTIKSRFGIQIEDKHRPKYILYSSKLTKAEWALLEVTDGMLRGSDLRDSTGMSEVEGDAIVAYVKRLRLKYDEEWRKAEVLDMLKKAD